MLSSSTISEIIQNISQWMHEGLHIIHLIDALSWSEEYFNYSLNLILE